MFDVDVEDGALPRKLAINRGDNPYDVADRFLEENGLPQTYRCEVPATLILEAFGVCEAVRSRLGMGRLAIQVVCGCEARCACVHGVNDCVSVQACASLPAQAP